MTPLQVKAIAYIREYQPAYAQYIADAIAPRKYGWSPQGATRWIGALLKKPLAEGHCTRSRDNGVSYRYYAK